jgi:hypothetical protein
METVAQADRTTFLVTLVAIVGDVDRGRACLTLRAVLSTLNEQLADRGVHVRFLSPGHDDPDAPTSDPQHMYDLRRNQRLCEIEDDPDCAAQLDLVDAGAERLGCVECLSRLVLREEATLALLRDRITEVAS